MSLLPPLDFHPRCFALVPCAGFGQRAGTVVPKQYAPVAGQAVVAHTLDALARVPGVTKTLVVLSTDDNLFEAHVPDFAGWVVRCGGATRAASVTAGLEALVALGADRWDWVLVHDAARCLLRAEWVNALIEACQSDDVGGVLALPLADTLKQSDKEGRVAHTIDRAGKWVAQTPQMFRIGSLQRALAQAGEAVTDEASAMECVGVSPRLVRGHMENFKLTWPEDFALAEQLMRGRASVVAPRLSDSALTTLLRNLEALLMDPHQHANPQLEAYLADDFVEVGSSGVLHERMAVLAWLRRPDRPAYHMSAFSAIHLSEGLVQVRYQAARLDDTGTVVSRSWRMGVWQWSGVRGWQLRTHQGTPCQDALTSTA